MATSTKTPLPPDQNRGPELLAVIWVFTALALLTVALKLYTRFKIIRQTGLDDVLIFFATLLIVICTILFTVDVHYGMGRHTVYLSLDNAILAGKLNYIANPFGIMAYSIPNISIAIFVNRILAFSTWRKNLLYSLAILQNIIAAISCVLLFVQCTPSASLWNPIIKPTSCLNASTLTNYSYFVGSFTAFTDVVLAVVPIMTFRKLKMKRNVKIAVSSLMGFTLVAAICAIVKTSKLNELADITDFTYASVDLIITAVVEADVIIIASCIPSLRPFVKAVSESISTSNARSLEGRHKQSRRSDRNWLNLSAMGGAHGSAENKHTKIDSEARSQGSVVSSSPEPLPGSVRVKTDVDMSYEYA